MATFLSVRLWKIQRLFLDLCAEASQHSWQILIAPCDRAAGVGQERLALRQQARQHQGSAAAQVGTADCRALQGVSALDQRNAILNANLRAQSCQLPCVLVAIF